MAEGIRENIFASLRLSPEDFARYKRATDHAYNSALEGIGNGSTLKVVGYGEDATAAIRASNPDGHEYLEVKWSPLDSVLWIMNRLEEQLRIPLRVWRLAGGGMVLDPGTIVGGHSLFQGDEIELFLVPGNMMADYIENNERPHIWKHLTPQVIDSTDPREKARAEFHLLDPRESTSWQTYYDQRTRADAVLRGILDQYSGEELEPLMEQIRAGVEEVLSKTELTDEQVHSIADGVVPFRVDADAGYGDDINDAVVLTRIYSSNNPAAIDVYFLFHQKTRWSSVEFGCEFLYRIHNPISSTDLAMSRQSHIKPGRQGWKLGFEMALDRWDDDDTRVTRTTSKMVWKLRDHHLDDIHSALFDTKERTPGKEVDNVDIFRLLMASVGVPLRIARNEGETDGQESNSIHWDLCGNEKWLGLKVREVCGVPLPQDEEYEPLPEYDEERRYDPDEDEDGFDEDEDEDEDGEGRWSD